MPRRLSKFLYFSLFFLLWMIYLLPDVISMQRSIWWFVISLLMYVLVLALGSIFIRLNFYLRSQNKLPALQPNSNKVEQNTRKIALTFDDGPAIYTEAILDILKKEQVAATFFLIGRNISGHEPVVDRMRREGHTIGNHSFYHGFNFDWQSARKMQVEIAQTNAAIQRITGQFVTLFRPPYGVTNPNLARALRRAGMKSIGWYLRSMDTIAKDEGQLTDKILRKLKHGDIVLLHDRCEITARILPMLIKSIKEKGFDCVAL